MLYSFALQQSDFHTRVGLAVNEMMLYSFALQQSDFHTRVGLAVNEMMLYSFALKQQIYQIRKHAFDMYFLLESNSPVV